MNSLLYLVWSTNPILVELGPIAIRWYGMCFALGFLVGYYIMQRFLIREGLPKEWMDSLLLYTMVGTIVGARLGHVFFYDWASYKDNLIDILKIWEGGLASHGGGLGVIVALYLWTKRVSRMSLIWSLDRIAITISIAAVFIRLGNFFNHEIVGKPTMSDNGVKFLRNQDDLSIDKLQMITDLPVVQQGQIDESVLAQALDKLQTDPALADFLAQVPNRYPTQLYEAASYLALFLILLFMYYRTNAARRPGLIFGAFLVLMGIARISIEFFKEVQVKFEEGMALDMGQWLSMPFVAAGIVFVVLALRRKPLSSDPKPV